MNILITGSNGQLGNEMRRLGATSENRYIYTDVTAPDGVETYPLDITDRAAVEETMRREMVDVVVNCAAYTNVDRAEDDPATADLINHKAPAILAEACAQRGATLVHVSTDYVFAGDGCRPYREDDPTGPTGVYGRTKLAGEVAIAAAGCRHVILRTAWLYSPFGGNFVKTMRRLTAERDTLSVVFDQIGTPTYALDLATTIFKIVEERLYNDHSGLYHFTDEGVCSWYDFACAIRDLSGGGREHCAISPCHSDEFPSRVHRPAYSVLDKTKVKHTFGIEIPHWYDSLVRCIALLNADESR